ncbi:MAG: xanthine dehydrogenase accessory protein XdhC [SAR324 cluster bacterium]|nr:xanthine dehydrogenase accessory protein XdhC [SAR324 cluster bacterium]
MDHVLKKLNELSQNRVPSVVVILVDTIGSTPQSQGSKMLVTEKGLYSGTIGGGNSEKEAIEVAQSMLMDKNPVQKTRFIEWNLNRETGMPCGGGVKLYFEVLNSHIWEIVVFGAGHIANAVIPLLLQLDCQITCYDSREKWLAKLPTSSKLKVVQTNNFAEAIDAVSKDSFVLSMTKSHKTDAEILQQFLERGKQPYLGVIGSDKKAAALRKDLEANGLPPEQCNDFICPLGLPIGTNHPHEIAISIAAQLLEVRDRFFSSPSLGK